MSQQSTEQHHTTKTLAQFFKNRINIYIYRSNAHLSFQEKLDLLLDEFHRRGAKGEPLEDLRGNLYNHIHPLNLYQPLIKEFDDQSRLFQLTIDEKRSLDRNELKVHFRSLIFRGLTTLMIGCTIMFIYWLAAKLGIQLPLLRIPV
ncbi:hypothetical protein [Aeromonas veronii]|uniref:hypothetical protein n=1 Tax=Aeromonas veronii TaxID=654 RepID=UPI003D1C302A